MTKSKGLTLSLIIEAESANYGEGFANIALLKKFTRNDRKQYTYISRQALRYSMMKQLGWNNTPVDGSSNVVQFAPKATIEEYPEIDLFGYLKTTKGDNAEKRAAVVRLSNAISLEPYQWDVDFLNNMGLSERTVQKGTANELVQSEIHRSFYSYTITIDLDEIGVEQIPVEPDKKEKSKNISESEFQKINKIPQTKKADRVNDFLEVVQFLNRDIRGREENLNPIFVIGGIYDRKNPYFDNRLKLKAKKLDVTMIEQILASDKIKDQTYIGYLYGMFENDSEITAKLNPVSIAEVFTKIKKEVAEYYGK